MSVIVFHLTEHRGETVRTLLRLRYDYDPRCEVDHGDIWDRTSPDGAVSHHRVDDVRLFEGISGAEIHVFLVPIREIAAQ